MRRCMLIVVLGLLLSLTLNVVAQETKAPIYPEYSAFTFKPTLSYAVFIPSDKTVEVQARPMGELGLAYIVPVTPDGKHNLRVGVSGGIAEDVYGAGFGLGYAFAPPEVQNVVIGIAGVFQLGWPNDKLRAQIEGVPLEDLPTLEDTPVDTWLNIGFEGSVDFKAAGLPAGLLAGYTFGVRDSPDQFFFAVSIPMQTAAPEKTIKRSQ